LLAFPSSIAQRARMPPVKRLQGLVEALAQLDPSERAQVVEEAARRSHAHAPPVPLAIHVIRGGTEWIGGDLRREDIYGDEGR
jgi:hypothetical protein